MSKGVKLNVREYLEGDEIDLSLQGVTSASLPVKDLALVKKGKKLDLSKNQILTLPELFVSSMGHLVKLDLSGNGLVNLPLNIGNLALLQHLDLFNNKLSSLPTGMFKLKALKWLDVKENPELEFPPPDVVGLCRNDSECKTCASQVVEFLRKENADQEKKKQKELELKRAKKEALKRELERLEKWEMEEKKRAKQEEKARRKADYEERVRSEPVEVTRTKESPMKPIRTTSPTTTTSSRSSFCSVAFVSAVILVIAIVVILSIVKPDYRVYTDAVKEMTKHTAVKVSTAVNPILVEINTHLLAYAPGIQKTIASTSNLLSEMIVICQDTLVLGTDLALQEANTLYAFLQKTYFSQ